MKTTKDGIVREDGNISFIRADEASESFWARKTATVLPVFRNPEKELDDLKALLRSKGVI